MRIWIDDLREPPDDTWEWVKTSLEAINLMRFTGARVTGISFDHDLGGSDTSRPVVIWMIENDFRVDDYDVHSANPVGAEWLMGMISRYLQ